MPISISYARAVSKAHKKENKCCEDFVDGYLNDDEAIIALADGGGSKKYAFETARLLCRKIIELFISNINFMSLDESKLVSFLNDALVATNLPLNEMGSTFLFVAVKDGKYLAGHTGDGVIIKGDGENFTVLSKPENGEFANVTYFLPNLESGEKHMRLYRGDANESLSFILASDGVADMLYDYETLEGMNICNKLNSWNKKYSKNECDETIKYNLENVLSEYSSDDLSIAVMSLE
ncbi:MAG: protein phosphatase 2C domain-containing protein [Eubacterium sp.]|nr:protein phosphatase 2C domain-containing protein [Eubacterium sp.]